MRNCIKADNWVQFCGKKCQMEQMQRMSIMNTFPLIQSHQDHFCIHAEVLAKKDGAPNPSRSWGIPIKPSVSSRVRIHVTNGPTQMSNPNERTNAVGTNPDLFSIHAKVPANKDRARNPSCPLSYCNRAAHFIKPCVNATNGPKDSFKPKRKDLHCWNQSSPLQYTCRSTRKQGWMLGIHLVHAVLCTKLSISHSHACMKWKGPKQTSNPNEMTDTVGTSRDLFCIHAEVPANKREGRDPSCSCGIAIKPAVTSSHVHPSVKWTKTHC